MTWRRSTTCTGASAAERIAGLDADKVRSGISMQGRASGREVDVALSVATQNELNMDDAKRW